MSMKKLMQLLRENAATERKPLNLVRAEDAAEATLYVYDVIDSYWGVNAQDVASAIAALDKSTTLHLRINSPGGDVFEGRAIATAIREFAGKTIAHIDGWAASAATTVANAADEIEISEGGFYMIHNSWTYAAGNKHDLRETAALLDKVDEAIIADYAKRTGKTTEQLAAWMDAETWFTAEEAVANGFATRIAATAGEDDKAQNVQRRAFNLGAFDKVPKALLEAPKPKPQSKEIDQAAILAHNKRRLQILDFA